MKSVLKLKNSKDYSKGKNHGAGPDLRNFLKIKFKLLPVPPVP